ncbi:uncharacterized protein LOC132043104 [Lycium ferocissimum]|uniref:uncharacterized protein LOC132043104 n=1 Tax=Lycium ferocissimum TaxID=112874 RepID=UPI002814A47D|nr:uncharacterized protein LOC132043104 [Lycium ferocissimum]
MAAPGGWMKKMFKHDEIEGFNSKITRTIRIREYNIIKLLREGIIVKRLDEVVAYASRQLKSHQKGYLAHNLTLAAMVLAIKIWRHYLYRVHVDIFTYHKNLQYTFKRREFNILQRSWLELLKHYDIDILYYPEIGNVVTDALSHDPWKF